MRSTPGTDRTLALSVGERHRGLSQVVQRRTLAEQNVGVGRVDTWQDINQAERGELV